MEKKNKRGRPPFKLATPTRVHRELLSHYNNDLAQIAADLGVQKRAVVRWFHEGSFPLHRIYQLSLITHFSADELMVLHRRGAA